MKKGILFSLALLVVFTIFSQDYQCIKSGGEYLFYGDYLTRAIAIDSVQDHSGYQTYYNFRVIGEEDYFWPGCLSKEWSSWIGPQTDIYLSGEHIFYNFLNEPVLIHTRENPGYVWTCFAYAAGMYIECTISEKVEMEFIGITDSVKKITFQYKNPDGTPAGHNINSKQLWVSKNHGMVKALNFKSFPDVPDLLDYEVKECVLAGISVPEAGIQNLTTREIFDFDIGDEFHVWTYSWSPPGETDTKSIITVTGKEWLSEDIVKYTKKRCGRRIYYTNMIEDTTYYYDDTITETIDFNNSFMTSLDALSESYTEAGDSLNKFYEITYQDFYEDFGRRTKNTFGGYYSEYPHDCIQQIITKKEANSKDYGFVDGYADGLGGQYFYDYDWGMYHSGLVYYKKGDEVWGTPYYCDSLLTRVNETKENLQTSLYPNPMSERAILTIDNKEGMEYSFYLYNAMGTMVRQYQFHKNELVLPRENLTNGIYFYILTSDTQFHSGGKLIVK